MKTTITNRSVAPGKYTWEQKIFSHIWLVYCVSFPKSYMGSRLYLTNLATKSVNTTFADKNAQKLIGRWKLVWGVDVYQKTISSFADSTMYVAKYLENSDKDKYVISIAGTNPFSFYTIFKQVLKFDSVQQWKKGKPWESKKDRSSTDEPAVSSGLSLALQIHMERMEDSQGKLLVDFLKEITNKATKPVEITVAGHSLGGTIAPLLGLSLLDRQSEWDSNNGNNDMATVKVVSVAGMNPGNEAFAEYYRSKLGDRTERVCCDIDPIPYMGTEDIDKISSLYKNIEGVSEEDEIAKNFLVRRFSEKMERLTKKHKYQPICDTQAYEGRFNENYLAENLSKNWINPNYNEYLKEYVVTECQTFLNLILQRELIEKLPDVDFIFNKIEIEDVLENFSEGASELLALFITEILGRVTSVKESTEKIVTELNELVPLPFFDNALENFYYNFFANYSVLGLVDYLLQFAYQHTEQYVEEYKFPDFDNLRIAITGEMEKQIPPEQKANTVMIECAKATTEEIKDFKNSEGKLFNEISDELTKLKASGEIGRDAQPVVIIVEKKKERGVCGWI